MWAVPVAVLSLVVAGCTSTGSGGTGKVQATGETYPLSWIISAVGGDRVWVNTLVAPGSEPHGYELSPQQVTALGRSDLVVYVRTLATAVDDAVKAEPPKSAIDLTTVLPTRPAVAQSGASGAGGIDPHLWLDPAPMPKVVDAVASQLSTLDPSGTSVYKANATALDARFATLASDYTRGLASCATTTLVVTHPAFGYLTDQYHLTEVGVSGVDEDTEPSPARLVEVEKIARAAKVSTVFYGDTSNPKIAQVIASSIGARTAELAVLESSAPAGEDYFTALQHNLATLKSGLGCS